jgi:hypothetical protein
VLRYLWSFASAIGSRWFPMWANTRKERGRRSWIGHIFRIFRGRYIAGSAVIGALIYFGGFGAASLGHLEHQYFRSPVWALAAVTAWVFAWGEWSDRALHDLPKNLQPALREQLSEQNIDRWYSRFYDALRDLTAGAALAAPVIWLTFAEPEFWEKRFGGWSAHKHLSQAILTGYFFLGALLTSTMLYGLWNYLRFTDEILRRDLNADLHVARAALQHLTSFGLATGLGWTVAVALVAEVFARAATALSLGLLAAFTVLGFALILLPQLLAHAALLRTRDELLAVTARELGEPRPANWLQRFLLQPDERSTRVRDYLKELAEARAWIYTPPQALLFLIQIGGALTAIFVHRSGH